MIRAAPYLQSAPAAALLLGLLAGPVILLVRVSLYEPRMGRGYFTPGTWTVSNFESVTDGYRLGILGFTGLFGIGVAAISLLGGYPLALFISGRSPRQQRLALAAVLLPKIATPLVTMLGLQLLLSAGGPLSHLLITLGMVTEPVMLSRSPIAAALAEAYFILPYVVVVMVLQLWQIDPTLGAAARGLGASRWQVFRRVTLPLSLPGLVLSAQFGLIWGMGAFLGPMFLGSPQDATLSVEIHRQAFEYGRWTRAAADAVLLVASIGLALALFGRATRRGGG